MSRALSSILLGNLTLNAQDDYLSVTPMGGTATVLTPGAPGPTGLSGGGSFTISSSNTNLEIEPFNKVKMISGTGNQFTYTLQPYSYNASFITFKYNGATNTQVVALSNNVGFNAYTYGIQILSNNSVNIYVNNLDVSTRVSFATPGEFFTILVASDGVYFYQNGSQIWSYPLVEGTADPLYGLFGLSHVEDYFDQIGFGTTIQGPTGPQELYKSIITTVGEKTSGTGPGYIQSIYPTDINLLGNTSLGGVGDVTLTTTAGNTLYVPNKLLWTSNTGCRFYPLS